ncbi:MAG: SWF/SNF helicase family protein, partial [Cytophagaceae bacterium]|nr:SWF/SNF helicase family protein [Cytophagaceae bacterium]
SYLINIDIPWNPAVLEQRIGRIHRMGQQKNVTIINLIAQNTIEHRMLEVLRFKSSLAEGILDNGEPNIFIGESKFNKFMQSVEEIAKTGSEQETPVVEENEESYTSQTVPEIPGPDLLLQDDDVKTGATPSDSFRQQQPASELMETGIKFMQQLSGVLRDPDAVKQLAQSITEKDPDNGKTYLKIQVDSEEVVHGLMQFLGGLLRK